jgi:hypothetical protein
VLEEGGYGGDVLVEDFGVAEIDLGRIWDLKLVFVGVMEGIARFTIVEHGLHFHDVRI